MVKPNNIDSILFKLYWGLWICGSRTTPHQITLGLVYCPPGPLSLGPLHTRTTPHRITLWPIYCPPGLLSVGQRPTRTTPHQDNSPQDNTLAHLLPTRTADNTPLGQLHTRTTPHQITLGLVYCPPGPLSLGQHPTRTTPHQDNSPQDNTLARLLSTRTAIRRTTPH